MDERSTSKEKSNVTLVGCNFDAQEDVRCPSELKEIFVVNKLTSTGN